MIVHYRITLRGLFRNINPFAIAVTQFLTKAYSKFNMKFWQNILNRTNVKIFVFYKLIWCQFYQIEMILCNEKLKVALEWYWLIETRKYSTLILLHLFDIHEKKLLKMQQGL